MSNNINKIMEAYKSMVSEMRGATAGSRQSRTFPLNKQSEADAFAKKCGGKVEKKGATLYVTWDVKEEAELDESLGAMLKSKIDKDKKDQADARAKVKAKGGVIGKKGSGVKMKEELDPVNDKENDKKFKDRKDKDIDNDGDVDSSDEYLHKRRKATDDAIDAKKKENTRAKSTKDIKHNDHTSDKKAEISKIESVDTREAFIAMWSELEEAVNPKKGATSPEEIDSKESPKSKEFIAKHKQSDKKIEDNEEDGHDKTFKAGGKAMKQAPSRGNDNLKNGDTNVVNPVKGK